MSWQYAPQAIILFLTAGLSALIALVTWRRRDAPGGRLLTWLMLAVAEWTIAAALEIAAVDPAAKILWSKIGYLGTHSVPVLYLHFALEYSQQDKWLTRRRALLLWVIPIITCVLAATNERHSLVWNSFTPIVDNGVHTLVYGHGPWFWVAVAYAYLMTLAGTGVLLRALVLFPDLYRRQIIPLALGAISPLVGSAIYLLKLGPPGLDTTPISTAFTGLFLAWAIFRQQLFDLAPIAYDVLVENLRDGVIVLDNHNRILDLNPAAQQLIGASRAAIGQPTQAVLARWPDLLARYRDVLAAQAEIVLEEDPPTYLDLRISPLYDRRKRLSGRLVLLHDITERKQTEVDLRQAKEAAEAASRAKSAFLANMSHELRTPMNAILGFSEMMANDSNLTAEQQENLVTISHSGKQLLAMINNVLELTKMDRGTDADRDRDRETNREAEGRDTLAAALAATPSEWKSQLHQATIEGDLGWMRALIEQRRGQNPSLAETLADMVDNFEHSDILGLLEQSDREFR
ncbi:MAG: PAS domain-containing protein [Thermoflexales bacterium]|nr:PAS domain-containing protein [Thermoflexales bacterium]